MNFDTALSDKEIVNYVKIMVKIPSVRRSLLASLEQLCTIYRDHIADYMQEVKAINIPVLGGKFPSPGEQHSLTNSEPRVIRFQAMRKKGNWGPVGEGPLDIESSGKLAKEIFLCLSDRPGKKNIRTGKSFYIGTSMGYYFISVIAADKGGKKVTIEARADVCLEVQRKAIKARPHENKIIFLNILNLEDKEQQNLYHDMINDMIANPLLGDALLEYFNAILKPLFRELSRQAAKE